MRLANIFALMFVFAASAQAATAPSTKAKLYRYRWTDSHGVMQYADLPTPEALQAGYDVIDSRGTVVKHVDRPKSAEERASDANAAQTAAQEKRRAAETEQADQQLLRAYPNEQALIDAQKRRLDSIDQQIGDVKVSQADQEKSLAEQLAYASTFERDGKPVPAPVKQQIETLRINVENQKKFVAARLAQRTDAEQKNQAELAHYRELRAVQARGASQP